MKFKTDMIAIDPGPDCGALVQIMNGHIVNADIVDMHQMLCRLRSMKNPLVIIEGIESHGMPVGRSVFDTCYMIGRIIELVSASYSSLINGYCESKLLYRTKIKTEICGTPRAKDPNVRQALIDMFEATGGGKTPQIGTKAKPGPLYGFKSHMWSALAVAVAYERMSERGEI